MGWQFWAMWGCGALSGFSFGWFAALRFYRRYCI